MDLPAGYAARAATAADIPAITALVVANDVADYGEPDYEEDDVRDEWSRPGVDVARDTRVVVAPGGGIVGYALAHERTPGGLVQGFGYGARDGADVHPWLVGWLTERCRSVSVAHLYTSAVNARAVAAHRAAGYDVVRVFRRMTRPLDAPVEVPDVAGLRLDAPGPDDLPAAWRVHQESFAGHYDFVPLDWDAWQQAFVRSPKYRPEYWWLARLDGEPVGVLVGDRHERDGFVRNVGVVPAARGRGVGAALLLAAFARFRADGAPRVSLGVDSDNASGAVALYERIGMTTDREYWCWELKHPAAPR